MSTIEEIDPQTVEDVLAVLDAIEAGDRGQVVASVLAIVERENPDLFDGMAPDDVQAAVELALAVRSGDEGAVSDKLMALVLAQRPEYAALVPLAERLVARALAPIFEGDDAPQPEEPRSGGILGFLFGWLR